MANITLYIPDELYEKMKKHKEIKWSEIARQAIEVFIQQLEEAELRTYALKRLAEGESAEELFDF